MGKKSSGSSNKVSVPKAPDPQNYYFYNDGELSGQQLYDKSKQAYISETFSSPFEKAQEAAYQDIFNKVYPQLQATPEARQQQIDAYGDSVYQQMLQPLTEARDQALLAGRENMNASGFLNSTSMIDYNNQKVGETYNKGLNDAMMQSITARENLQNNEQNRLLQLLGMSSGGLQNDFNNNLALGQFGLQGATTANNVQNQNYQNRLAQLQMQTQMNALNAGNAGRQRSFLGTVLNPFGFY